MRDFRRCTRSNPCQICGRPNAEHPSCWCAIALDGTVALCPFTLEGSVRDMGEAGYLHRLIERPREEWTRAEKKPKRWVGDPEERKPDINCEIVCRKAVAAITEDDVEGLAVSLGVSIRSLRRLSIGWSEQFNTFTFPMRDHRGEIIGIRTRSADGEKRAIKGSRNGLFIPVDLEDGPIYVCEGPTDTAAILSVGLQAIGRPMALGLEDQLAAFLRGREEVRILSDDDVVGMRGAEKLASILWAHCGKVKIIHPIHRGQRVKDARAWVNAGATHESVTAISMMARVFRVTATGLIERSNNGQQDARTTDRLRRDPVRQQG